MFHALKLLLQALGNHNIKCQHFEETYDNNICDAFSCQQRTCIRAHQLKNLPLITQSNRICILSCHPNFKHSIPGLFQYTINLFISSISFHYSVNCSPSTLIQPIFVRPSETMENIFFFLPLFTKELPINKKDGNVHLLFLCLC